MEEEPEKHNSPSGQGKLGMGDKEGFPTLAKKKITRRKLGGLNESAVGLRIVVNADSSSGNESELVSEDMDNEDETYGTAGQMVESEHNNKFHKGK